MNTTVLWRLCLIALTLFPQTGFNQCENTNGDMETGNFPITPFFPEAWINEDLDNWYVSHSSIFGYASPIENGSNHLIRLSAVEGGDNGGIYTSFEFEEGKHYQVTYELENINFGPGGIGEQGGKMMTRLANSLTPQGNGTTMPTVAGTQLVGTWYLVPGTTTATVDFIFEASDDYSQLWLYLDVIDYPGIFNIVDAEIDNLCITELPCHAVNEADIDISHEIPSGPIFFPFGAVEAVDFSVEGLPTTDYIVEYSWDFDDGSLASTSANPRHFYYSYGVFDVCVSILFKDPETFEIVCFRRICKTIRLDVSFGRSSGEQTQDEAKSEPSDISTLTVFPNPNQGEFVLAFDDQTPIQTIHIYNQTGQLVYHQENMEVQRQYHIDISDLGKGLYTIHLIQNDNGIVQTKRVIVQ